LELLTLGEKNIFYIQDNKENSQNAYIIHNTLPSDFQKVVAENKELAHENEKLRMEITFLKQQNESFQEIIRLMKGQS
jgi:hypothetical protein